MFARVNVVQNDISQMEIIFQSWKHKKAENNFVT
jgi:hypothetical protein